MKDMRQMRYRIVAVMDTLAPSLKHMSPDYSLSAATLT